MPVDGDVPAADGEDRVLDADTALGALGVSAALAAGVLATLTVRRRRQRRMRPPRHRIAVPDDEPGQLEWLAAHDERTTPGTDLDLALRCLNFVTYGPANLPVIGGVRLDDTGAALVTLATRAALPPPFVAIGEEDDWTYDPAQPLPVSSDDAAGACAPFPALVSIATHEQRTLLIDLEHHVVLRVGGRRDRVLGLLRHLAAELATNRTAEDAQILAVGLGEGLAAFNPDRLVVVEDLDAALEEIEARAAATAEVTRRHQLRSVTEGRLQGIAPDSWLPTILLIGVELTVAQRFRLLQLAETDRGRTAVAVVGFEPHATDVRIGDDGTLDLADLVDGPWLAADLPEPTSRQLSALLAATDLPAVPVQPATDPEPWATGMLEDGSLEPDDDTLEEANHAEHRPDADHDAGASPSVAHPVMPPLVVAPGPSPTLTPMPVPAAEVRAAPALDEAADPAALRRLAIVDHQDPTLDDDLAAWHAARTPDVPMIAILGEPVVRAPGTPPTARPSWFAEVLVYLALHPAGVTAAKAQSDLWPEGRRISSATVRHAFYGARRWAGRGYDGDPHATFVSDMQTDSTYKIRGYLLDWDLFRRLRKRGHARHHAHHPAAATDYRAALDLVRGAVLSALRPGGYAWLAHHDQRHDLQIPSFVVDAAHELVDIALAAGDTDLARRAAETGRLVDPDVAYDQPLTDLMRVAHAENNAAELEPLRRPAARRPRLRGPRRPRPGQLRRPQRAPAGRPPAPPPVTGLATALTTATGAAVLGPPTLFLAHRTMSDRWSPRVSETMAITAAVGLIGLLATGTPPGGLLLAPLAVLGPAAAIVDAYEQRLPDILTGPLLATTLLAATLTTDLLDAAVAAGCGLGVALLIKALHTEGLGWGDVKLLPSLAVVLAHYDAVTTGLVLTTLLITATALMCGASGWIGPVPYGPGLVVGTLVAAAAA